MSKGRLNALFSLLLLISGAIVLLAFFTWNDPRSYETELGNQITLINIEQCDLFDKRNKVKVRGWAYVEGNPRGRYQIYAQTDDGLYRKFEAFSRERGDVIEALELNSTFR
ncbi:MAG: hypothetical protein VX148_11580 [Pseudomonadota bacterium]|nr:hypothetical protein [Pseudomonadota bacterium]